MNRIMSCVFAANFTEYTSPDRICTMITMYERNNKICAARLSEWVSVWLCMRVFKVKWLVPIQQAENVQYRQW